MRHDGRPVVPRLAGDKPRLVHVFHRRARHAIAHRFGKAAQTLGASPPANAVGDFPTPDSK